VEKRRFGFPPGGLRGPPSSSHNASKMASILTGAFSPSGARNAGHEAIAASDKGARILAAESEGAKTA
jgi:hypothetical protein